MRISDWSSDVCSSDLIWDVRYPMRAPNGSRTRLERPGLKALLAAIDSRQVDVIVVYKVDRLTLNVLLSFAQFEREVTGERSRDKIAASKKNGIWMGGPVPLGYDVENRKLVVNDSEASLVRHIMQRYLQLASVNALADELNAQGYRTKLQRRDRTSSG